MTRSDRHTHPRLSVAAAAPADRPALAYADAVLVDEDTWVLRIQLRRSHPEPPPVTVEDLTITEGPDDRPAPFEIREVLGPQHHVVTVELAPAPTGPPLDRSAAFRVVFGPRTGIDPAHSSARFRIRWDADLDRVAPDPAPPIVSYQAKDYSSFRALMLDQLAQSAPEWVERNPADLGVVLVELLAHAGDLLSYQQDAAATEATLHTARLRTSVRRHARLLDYTLHEGCGARVWLHLRVNAPAVLEAGAGFCTGPEPFGGAGDPRARWDAPQTVFETVHAARLSPDQNEMPLHGWGRDRWVLGRGATETALLGHVKSLRKGDVLVFEAGGPDEPGGPVTLRHAVRLGEAPRLTSDGDVPITRIRWFPDDVLPFDVPVVGGPGTSSVVARGNLVLADEGGSRVLPPASIAWRSTHPTVHLRGHRLSASVPWEPDLLDQPCVELLTPEPREAVLDIHVRERHADGIPRVWTARRDLMSSGPFDRHFVPEVDARGDVALRFGDGVHGRLGPDPRAIEVACRFGSQERGNVAADTVIYALWHAPWFESVRNPLPARGGKPPETVEHGRVAARAGLHRQARCVTAEDYAAAARDIPGIADAKAALVWTGGWHTAVVDVLPEVRDDLDAAKRAVVERCLLDRRLVGTDVEVRAPGVVHIAITLRIGLSPRLPRSQIAAAVRAELGTENLPDGRAGYFHRDAWTLGRDVYAGPMLARLAAIPGVVWCRTEQFERVDPIPDAPVDSQVIRIRDHEVARLPTHGLLLEWEVAR